MKYGVITHKTTLNLGDDIQTYAAARLLPRVDYYLTRECLDHFASEDGEPVAVPMNAWWLWSKWNWPPAECIYPLLVSMHIGERDIYASGSPMKREWLDGIGGDFFRAYGPAGCRDAATVELLQSCGIDSYLSGCLTLTLPQQKKTEDAGTYACLVDLPPALEEKAREWLKDTGLRIVTQSHRCDYLNVEVPFDRRMKTVEEVLTLYQNAKVVITSRLHATLPCLAMGTPVVSIFDQSSPLYSTRWAPYSDWTFFVSKQDFANHAFDYDFSSPPANSPDYLPLRQALLERVGQFVAETKDFNGPIQAIKKTAYTEAQARQWQYDLMRNTLDAWLLASREMRAKNKEQAAGLKKQIADGKTALSARKQEIAGYKKEIAGQKKALAAANRRIAKTQNELDQLNRMFIVRCVKFARRKAGALLRLFRRPRKL